MQGVGGLRRDEGGRGNDHGGIPGPGAAHPEIVERQMRGGVNQMEVRAGDFIDRVPTTAPALFI